MCSIVQKIRIHNTLRFESSGNVVDSALFVGVRVDLLTQVLSITYIITWTALLSLTLKCCQTLCKDGESFRSG